MSNLDINCTFSYYFFSSQTFQTILATLQIETKPFSISSKLLIQRQFLSRTRTFIFHLAMHFRVVSQWIIGFSLCSFQVDSPLYLTSLSLFVYSLDHWNQSKITFLKRLLVTAHARHTNPSGTSKYELSIYFLLWVLVCVYSSNCVVWWFVDTMWFTAKTRLLYCFSRQKMPGYITHITLGGKLTVVAIFGLR